MMKVNLWTTAAGRIFCPPLMQGVVTAQKTLHCKLLIIVIIIIIIITGQRDLQLTQYTQSCTFIYYVTITHISTLYYITLLLLYIITISTFGG